MDRRDFAAALEHLPRRRDQTLPALHVVHAAQGWLSEPAFEAVSELTSVPLSELYGVAPVAEVAGRYHGRLTPERFRSLLSRQVELHR